MNIYQKLIEVRKSCEYLKKDNKGYQFNFVSSSQTLGTLRAAMDEQQLLLVPSVVKNEVRDHTTSKGGHEYFTILDMEFKWVNADCPEEFIICPWTGQGLDNGEKGVGKALTYAEKYFLLKFFNIATDKDDPDSNQRQPPAQQQQTKQPQRKPAAKQPSAATEKRKENIKDIINAAGSLEQVETTAEKTSQERSYWPQNWQDAMSQLIEARKAEFGMTN